MKFYASVQICKIFKIINIILIYRGNYSRNVGIDKAIYSLDSIFMHLLEG